MTQPQLAHQTPAGRMYARSVTGLPEVPSITTVIGMQHVDLTGWACHMATTQLISDARLAEAIGSEAKLKTLARQSNDAADRYRDGAAARGDRVHNYAEQVALRQLGMPHNLSQARDALAEHNESGFADRFDEWWQSYQVKPLAAELTVWNHTVGYAGTLDLVAEIGGRVCLIDYKTRGTDRSGRVKSLNSNVVMQLAAGYKAEESLVDAQAGTWEPWAYGQDAMLLGVAIGETEVAAYQAKPQILAQYWQKFWALRQVWQYQQAVDSAPNPLQPIGPPVATTQQS
ncbi:MAG TPA: PD-(D/E)XK nuclease family protein [Candidatus Yaniella excrementigallinarum]|nr:PD-(D/E)XK nuclease family protein [Candidatus Yaniella excrementigallinarum]